MDSKRRPDGAPVGAPGGKRPGFGTGSQGWKEQAPEFLNPEDEDELYEEDVLLNNLKEEMVPIEDLQALDGSKWRRPKAPELNPAKDKISTLRSN
eukprot:4822271-Pyramimonas_sp.AAC.1